jgi:assimilatory nitrate reductase catalytic subunit
MEGDWTRTTCPYCGVGCGVLAKTRADGSTEIKGDPDHPANFGRLCSKGSSLGETLSLDDRLLFPLVYGQHASWEMALDIIANEFGEAIAEYGPESVALYVSGQILTEDYYVANKFMKGYIGSANIDTNSRLCMASSVAGYKRAFGSDTVPAIYEDLELADLIVLVGSNLAWCHPILFQRIVTARKERGTKVVVIDPRATATCEIADLHLPIRPGTDVALFNGLLAHLSAADRVDEAYVRRHTSGFTEAIEAASALDLSEIARVCDLEPSQIIELYELFAATERTLTIYSQGVNQSTAGTDKVNAIINCHLLTGRIGSPGTGPFSVTGQPNAMGGREVGGLANMLAAHMELDQPEHRNIVQSFWRSPRIADAPGYKAVELFDAVADGRIKALWIMATNPIDSLPEADKVRRALEVCPFVAVSDVVRHTDTTVIADVLLPATAWGEKDGTVTNSERRISRQRAFLAPPGEACPDWWQICEVARRLGYGDAFSYSGPRDVFAEYAALTGFRNSGKRDLDISAYEEISDEAYASLEPFLWPQSKTGDVSGPRFFADGGYFTPDRRARFVPTPLREPASRLSDSFPFILNTGRVRDQWHTMTRTAKTPRLMSHYPEPFLEIHPQDAEALGLMPDGLAEVHSEHARVLLRVQLSEGQRRGCVFAPIHWTDEHASLARVDSLIAAETDPISGQPELKFTPVSVAPFEAQWYGFAVSAAPIAIPAVAYHALAPTKEGYRLEIADCLTQTDWDALAAALFARGADGDDEILTYRDARTGQFRYAQLRAGRLSAALFIAAQPLTVSRGWACEQLGRPIEAADRLRLLAGRPGAGIPDKGPIVCSCFEVGANQISEAVTKQGCASVEAVGACLDAGTNCGSCRAEIGRIVHALTISKAV